MRLNNKNNLKYEIDDFNENAKLKNLNKKEEKVLTRENTGGLLK